MNPFDYIDTPTHTTKRTRDAQQKRAEQVGEDLATDQLIAEGNAMMDMIRPLIARGRKSAGNRSGIGLRKIAGALHEAAASLDKVLA